MDHKATNSAAADDTPEAIGDREERFRIALDEVERKVLIFLAVSGGAETLEDLAEATGQGARELRSALEVFEGMGVLERLLIEPEPEAAEEDEDDAVIDEVDFGLIAKAARDTGAEDAIPPDRFETANLKKHYESLKGQHYYAMLGLDPGAELREIRRVYHEHVLQYHPDQHRDCEDPEKLEALSDVFSLLTQAYETLRSKKKRKRYDQTIPEVTGAAESEEEEALAALFDESASDLPAPREASKPAGWNFYEVAVEAFQAGDYQTADLNFKLAAGMEPDRPEYVEGVEKTREILNGRMLDQLRREARALEEDRKYHEAVATLVKAAELDPADPELRYTLARIRFLKTMDRLRAEEDVSWAVALDPKHIDALLLMGRIQAWKGNVDLAVKTFKQVLAIVPGHPKAKKALSLFENGD